MPGGGKNRRKGGNQYYHNGNNGNQNNQNQPQHHSNLSGGGGVRKSHNNFNKGGRKMYINPSIICSLSDDEATTRAQNNDRQNGFNNRSSCERKSNKNNRGKHMAEKFKDMGRQRTKFSIGDDDADKKPLLPSKPHCQISNLPADVFNIIVSYVQNYFTCFDTNREGLLGAYNKQCTFSLSVNQSNTVAYRQFKFDDIILKENRNLKRIPGNDEHHREKRFRLQHNGYIDTLAFLCKMPATEHDPRSFKLDIDFFSPNMIKFSLSGVYKEGKPTDKVRPLRSFHRVFVCIPDPTSQMHIVNEQYTISHLTDGQHKSYYSTPSESSSSRNQQQDSMNTTPPLVQQPSQVNSSQATVPVLQDIQTSPFIVGLNEQQILMLQQFSTQSRLNFEWSKYCLEHVNWIFEEGVKAFVTFKESIPKDAYI